VVWTGNGLGHILNQTLELPGYVSMSYRRVLWVINGLMVRHCYWLIRLQAELVVSVTMISLITLDTPFIKIPPPPPNKDTASQ
jgi:hypothetical protein